jgi:DNA invertase Pin-like site-specific DNA recombinase
MSHTPQYEKLLAELKAGELPIIVCKILDALSQAPKGLTRKGLIRIVFGEEPGSNLSNDTRDRKIRKGIEQLRNLGFPIVSTSGKAGYKLDTDPEKIASMIREWESRITQLQHRVDAVRHYRDAFLRVFPHKWTI